VRICDKFKVIRTYCIWITFDVLLLVLYYFYCLYCMLKIKLKSQKT